MDMLNGTGDGNGSAAVTKDDYTAITIYNPFGRTSSDSERRLVKTMMAMLDTETRQWADWYLYEALEGSDIREPHQQNHEHVSVGYQGSR